MRADTAHRSQWRMQPFRKSTVPTPTLLTQPRISWAYTHLIESAENRITSYAVALAKQLFAVYPTLHMSFNNVSVFIDGFIIWFRSLMFWQHNALRSLGFQMSVTIEGAI